VFQSVIGGKPLRVVLDQSPLDDLKTAQILAELIQKGYIVPL
jgi:hypothetical protein